MDVKKFLKNVDFSLNKKELDFLKRESAKVIRTLEESLKKRKINAQVFLGGSFAKGTITRSEDYDIDIFIRFEKKHDNLSELTEKSVKESAKVLGLEWDKLHGSRDYFRIKFDEKLMFEIIPVRKISNVSGAENVTDLSYFHVNYVKNSLSEKAKKDVGLAKKFCKSLRVYGAESYINGFSGYGLECLIIYYGSFEKMIKSIAKIKEREVIDIKKYYKNKEQIFMELNESKIRGPIVLIDPTWKERNVLAALDWESLRRFNEGVIKFMKNPSLDFFEVKDEKNIDIGFISNKFEGEGAHLILKTKKQTGDIAGTKLKKFSRFLDREISRFFEIKYNDFFYNGEDSADFYIVAKKKKEIIRNGPYVEDEKNAIRFRKSNKDTFSDDGRLYSRTKVDFSLRNYLSKIIKYEKERMKEMGISEFYLK